MPTSPTTSSSAHVKQRLAGYKAPRHVVRVDELVRSPTGKSDYRHAQATALTAVRPSGSA